MYRLCKKLQSLKPALRHLNKVHYGGIQEKVLLAHEKLLSLQNVALQSPSSTTFAAAAA